MTWQEINQAPTALDKLALFEGEITGAGTENVIKGLPRDAEQFKQILNSEEMGPVLRDRLYRLGYLNDPKGDNPETLKKAIQALQDEAGLTVDGWIGVQTWSALQELFTFENFSNLARWNTAKPSVFFQRAIELRLIALGLVADRERVTLDSIQAPWQTWKNICIDIDLVDNELADQQRYREVLFDIDKLTHTVAVNQQKIITLSSSDSEYSATLNNFLSALLKIELWLHGYHQFKPDGLPLQLTRTRRTQTRTRTYVYSSDYRALRKFWRDVGAETKHDTYVVLLLRGFPLLVDDSELSETEQHRKMQFAKNIDELMVANMDEAKKQWQEQGWGAWVWDGIKRVFKAIRKWFSRITQGITQALHFAVRGAKQLVSESVSYVTRTFKILEDGFSLLFESEIRGSNSLVAMSHDRDFDFKVFVAKQATNEDVDKLLVPLREQMIRLKAALRISSLVLSLISGALTIATIGWRWWRLIKLLIDFNHQVDENDISIIREAYRLST